MTENKRLIHNYSLSRLLVSATCVEWVVHENLQATYNNETSLTCSVDMNTVSHNIIKIHCYIINHYYQLTLPDRVGQQSVDVTIHWVGLNNIDHPIDAVTPVTGML